VTRSQQEAVEVVAGKDNHQGVKAFASSPLFSTTYDRRERMMEIAYIRWQHEDELPDTITANEYDELYPSSEVKSGTRMFPYVNIIVGSNSAVRVYLKKAQNQYWQKGTYEC